MSVAQLSSAKKVQTRTCSKKDPEKKKKEELFGLHLLMGRDPVKHRQSSRWYQVTIE